MEENQNPSGSVDTNLSENKPAENHEHDTVAYRTYQKVLNEAKSAKERAKDYESRLNEVESRLQGYEQAELEKQGKTQEVIAHLRDRAKTLESKLQEKDELFGFSKTTDAIKMEAINQGCVDVDAFMSLIRKDDLKGIEISEGYRPNIEDVKVLVDDFKKRYDKISLFKKEAITTNDIPIKSKLEAPKAVKGIEELSKLSHEELQAHLKTLRNNS